ncbi:MAG: DUF5053 domain-containing protein [Prevotellaceae bacterium]|jgi:hypothetical protein|nr:DUF5053 domain-containing protein [Prevotellaceae bacterium]
MTDKESKELKVLPIEEFKKKFNEIYHAANDAEKAEIMQLFKKDATEHTKKLNRFIEETTLKMQLGDMIEIIPLAYIARTYFHKSKHWLYQRIHGYMINGKHAKFTGEQLQTFNNALKDIGDKIGSIKLV